MLLETDKIGSSQILENIMAKEIENSKKKKKKGIHLQETNSV